jgi:ribosome biogenesis SPOUT family RNA methylase Rps3
MPTEPKTYVVEHLDPELGPWSELEYISIARETRSSGSATSEGAVFTLSSLPAGFRVPAALAAEPAFRPEHRSVEDIYTGDRAATVCLLDPQADRDLSPADGETFSVFLFGGILGEFDFTGCATWGNPGFREL